MIEMVMGFVVYVLLPLFAGELLRLYAAARCHHSSLWFEIWCEWRVWCIRRRQP